ncbi:MAG: GNAT family N-acetyltransferase [Angelakisella sp.]
MRIEKTNVLTMEQIKAVSDLEKAAFKKHRLENHAFLSNDINFDKRIPCFYMGYDGDRLVAFLSFFIPTQQEAEISAVTHPDFQRRGYFTELLNAAKSTLLAHKIKKILFVLEPKSKSGLGVLKTFQGNCFERSEYRMSLDNLDNVPSWDPLQFFEVDQSNKALFQEVLRQIHPDMEDQDNYVEAVVNSDTRKGYIAYRETPIGVFNINYEDGNAFLYGVGIAEKHRGNGFGKQLTGYAIAQGLKNAPKVVLDVDSDNPTAFHIYKKCGFQIDFQVDYYSYNLS